MILFKHLASHKRYLAPFSWVRGALAASHTVVKRRMSSESEVCCDCFNASTCSCYDRNWCLWACEATDPYGALASLYLANRFYAIYTRHKEGMVVVIWDNKRCGAAPLPCLATRRWNTREIKRKFVFLNPQKGPPCQFSELATFRRFPPPS